MDSLQLQPSTHLVEPVADIDVRWELEYTFLDERGEIRTVTVHAVVCCRCDTTVELRRAAVVNGVNVCRECLVHGDRMECQDDTRCKFCHIDGCPNFWAEC